MYAVIETGGKQYRVELGTELAIERLDATPGSTIDFGRVLLVADGESSQIGTPTVAEAVVTADVLRQDRGAKLIVFKYRPKARHRSKKGHRQEQTVVRIADIRFDGRSAAEEAGAEKADEQAAQAKAQAAAEKKAAADQALAAKLTAAEAEKKVVKSVADKAAKADDVAPTPPKKTATKTSAASTKAAKPAATETAAEDEPKAEKKPKADEKPKTARPRGTRSSTKKDE